MSLLDAFAIEPFSVNEPLIDALLLEPDMAEVYLVNTGTGGNGSGTITDPRQVPTAAAFDLYLPTIPANTTIHLGPGTFETNGYGNDAGWEPKAGWRIIGAGTDVTTLRLTGTFVAHEE